MGFSLLADIGGTHARFAVTQDCRDLQRISVYQCSDYSCLSAAISAYLQDSKLSETPLAGACLAIAGTVKNDRIDMANSHWKTTLHALQEALGVTPTIINDFTAQAMCIDALAAEELEWLDKRRPQQAGTRLIIGPGTGLGVAAMQADGTVLASEGGHARFAPGSPHQLDLLNMLWQRFPNISNEQLLSGQGLENIFWANSRLQGQNMHLSAAEISASAATNEAIARQSIEDLLDILAATAGDLAMTFWAEGGVYLTGGVLEKLASYIEPERFRRAFSGTGPLADFCADLPIAILRSPHPGLRGCMQYMALDS